MTFSDERRIGTASASRGFAREKILRALAWGVLALVVGVFGLGVALVARGREAMERSDAAFHRGDLVEAIAEARTAALYYVPGARHVHEAEGRLEAIARGAEAEGNWKLARRAWDALRLIAQQTHYPGRPASEAGQRAQKALKRLDARQMENRP